MSRPPIQSRSSSSASAGAPRASISRMILSPLARLARRLAPLGIPTTLPSLPTPSGIFTPFILALKDSLARLDLSLSPSKTLQKLSTHQFTPSNTLPLFLLLLSSLYSLYNMHTPSLPFLKYLIPLSYTLSILIPLTSQFTFPATPIFAWLLLFFSARFLPSKHRPGIHVALLPALEAVLYGANISDLQTRYTNPVLDIIAWLPYGLLHYTIPFVVALILWTLGPRGSVQYWGKAFGWMNFMGVVTQLVFPCAAPWYEIIHGLTPANYSMSGSPGGLLRIDRIFHSSGYTNAFGNSPLVFGAFPSLHSGCAVIEALFLSHFFPRLKPFYWTYVGVLWWATMYLSHHYLIDLTGGACLSVLMFYGVMPEAFKDVDAILWQGAGFVSVGGGGGEGKGKVDGLDLDEEIRKLEEMGEREGEGEDEEEVVGSGEGSSKGKGKRSVSWGETKVMGEGSDARAGEDQV